MAREGPPQGAGCRTGHPRWGWGGKGRERGVQGWGGVQGLLVGRRERWTVWGCTGPKISPSVWGAECRGRVGQDSRLPLRRGTGGVGWVLPRAHGAERAPAWSLAWPSSPAEWLPTQNGGALEREPGRVGPPPMARLPAQDPLGSGLRAGCVLPGHIVLVFWTLPPLVDRGYSYKALSGRAAWRHSDWCFLLINNHLEELKGLFL